MHGPQKFAIPQMRNFVPVRIRPWLVIGIVIIFQLSGSVYLGAVNEMTGSLALMHEDIMMAGYASMIGLALCFAIMLRLKFRLPSKPTFIICSVALILANVICMNTDSVPLLVGVSFVAGFFRMWATFECNSTIQLWLTPKRDLSIFFCYIYLLVNGIIQLSGITTIYASEWGGWEYMHWAAIGGLGIVIAAVCVLYKNIRVAPYVPLLGIDWLGAILWAVTMLSIQFVCIYGEHYDWWNSEEICVGSLIGLVSLALNLWRASFVRHPYINLRIFRYTIVWITMILYLIVDILLAPSHVIEHAFMEHILGYDSLHTMSLNWVSLLGTIMASIFTWRTFAVRKWRYKDMSIIAFLCITAYLMMMYFSLDYDMPKMSFVLPIFLRSFGYVICAIIFLTALTRISFDIFFHSVCFQGFLSAGIAGLVGTAIVGRLFSFLIEKNTMLIGANIDRVNGVVSQMSIENIYGQLMEQAMIVSMKEVYGWLIFVSIAVLLFFVFMRTSFRPKGVIMPKFRKLRKIARQETMGS